ncbi:MAG TPA: hypothetical protein VEQ10_20465, partial [Vicinamibacteria bacterium]|nr:hypothetical protein [Vicinamibacteria bacterium]
MASHGSGSIPAPALLLSALLLPLATAPGVAGELPRGLDQRDPAGPPRVAVFRSAGFPTADAPPVDDATLSSALSGLGAESLDSASAVSERLKLHDYDVLLLPYGSAFPVDAWPAIRDFVRAGGGLVVLGGAPLHQPVRWQAGAWVMGFRQPTWAHELLIGSAQELDLSSFAGPLKTVAVAGSGWTAPLPEAKRTWALTVRLTDTADMPGQDGSAGPREGTARPLVHVLDGEGLPRACPLLEIDRLRGAGQGGRWVFAPSDAALDAELIRAMVARALDGAWELDARPVRAAVEPGETAVLRILLQRPLGRTGEVVSSATVTVRDDGGRSVWSGEVPLGGPKESRSGYARVTPPSPLGPGLYRATVEIAGVPWQPRSVLTGFWVEDHKLLASGPKLTVSRDWLRKGGTVMPVVGTTYMAQDVHRKFLFEPNPAAWDRDFAAMAKQGVNLVRTGLWTAWSRVMLDPGAVDENVLSALDAYVLSAARHDVVVCFNLFAFIPPAYGGSNPYLDPRSIEGQRALVSALATRYRGSGWIHWDLINEPSYARPEDTWKNRAIGDAYERSAWTAWVKAKHGDLPAAIRDLWRDPGDDLFSVPRGEEMEYAFLREGRRPRKARDFGEFTQDAAASWMRTLRAVLKEAGGPEVLVTLGQDEGGTGTRPAPSIYYDSLDYTSVHTWWNNDDLLWDGVMTKAPEVPNLHQETGLMSLEDTDGFAWRTPEAAADLLERKFAYAFTGRGAGVVQWAWNVNPYQPIDNEATIGLWRPDGTAKAELRSVPAFAQFFAKAAPYLDDFAPDPVVIVIPHSRMFMGRAGGADGTKRVVRLLAERFGVVPTALSEIRLSAERLKDAKLVLVPTPEVLQESAAAALLAATRAGTRVLVTGAVEGDSYGRTTESLKALGIVDAGRPLALHEPTGWGGAGTLTFEGLLQEKMRRASGPSPAALVGNLWHEPLPIELARETEPLV